jgi:plastocyanin
LKMRSIFIFLAALLIIGLSLGQNAANNSSTQNIAAPGNASAENASSLQNADAAQAAENATPATDLNYIWSVGGIEAGQITMVLNQDGDNLFGQAKYEPENGQPWNGDVTGSVSGDKVALVITAAKDKKLVSNKLDGVFDNASQTIQGKFVQMSEGKIVGNGEFNAMWISPDVSSYTPAKIEEPKPATPQLTASGTQPSQNTIEITSSSFQPNPLTVQVGTTVTWINSDTKDQAITARNGQFDSGNIIPGGQYQYTFSQPGTFDYYSKITPSITGKVIVAGSSKSRFVDVREYKDKIGPGGDLSGVPPGMGGSIGA